VHEHERRAAVQGAEAEEASARSNRFATFRDGPVCSVMGRRSAKTPIERLISLVRQIERLAC
jgi:hypothetical protein